MYIYCMDKPRTLKVEELNSRFELVQSYVVDFFESKNFPFDFWKGNKSKTNFGQSWYYEVDSMEEYFMESITIRISDHSTGQRRAASEIMFSQNSTKENVENILGNKFNEYNK